MSKHILTAYVDGSYNTKLERYGYGVVLLTPEGEEMTLSGSGNNPETLAIHNVAGEMLAAMHAVSWAKKHGYAAIRICYDYSGIEMWATGAWKRKNPLTAKYHEYMKESMKTVRISFEKVEAHTGVTYNEMADKLAKEAILKDAEEKE
ncbi:MAG: reverse transcriptase-like protein [Lachnospiraceae bacterium]|nr:reverse transcriptase-like protein [Lachnospiraceae bacterium]